MYIVDNEDFGLLMVALLELVCSCAPSLLTGIEEIVKISTPLHGIYGGTRFVLQSLFVQSLHTDIVYSTLKDGVPLN
jgi:hypothetical protein